MHRLIAAAAVLDFVLAPNGVFDRIRCTIFAADEPFERGGVAAAGFTTTGDRQSDSADA